MWIILIVMAIILLFITSWGSAIIYCLGQHHLACIGLLLFAGILILTFLTALIYCVVVTAKARARDRLKITQIADEMTLIFMEYDSETDKWYTPPMYAAVITAYIVIYGAFGPIFLIKWFLEWLFEQFNNDYSRAA